MLDKFITQTERGIMGQQKILELQNIIYILNITLYALRKINILYFKLIPQDINKIILDIILHDSFSNEQKKFLEKFLEKFTLYNNYQYFDVYKELIININELTNKYILDEEIKKINNTRLYDITNIYKESELLIELYDNSVNIVNEKNLLETKEGYEKLVKLKHLHMLSIIDLGLSCINLFELIDKEENDKDLSTIKKELQYFMKLSLHHYNGYKNSYNLVANKEPKAKAIYLTFYLIIYFLIKIINSINIDKSNKEKIKNIITRLLLVLENYEFSNGKIQEPYDNINNKLNELSHHLNSENNELKEIIEQIKNVEQNKDVVSEPEPEPEVKVPEISYDSNSLEQFIKNKQYQDFINECEKKKYLDECEILLFKRLIKKNDNENLLIKANDVIKKIKEKIKLGGFKNYDLFYKEKYRFYKNKYKKLKKYL